MVVNADRARARAAGLFDRRQPGFGRSPLYLHAVLALILAAAASLRLSGIGRESLWLDEGYTTALSQRTLAQILGARDTHPPLFPLILHAWTRIFGISETALRSLSALFGVLSVASLYRLVHKWQDRRTALTASALLAASGFAIYYSQEVRPYSLLLWLSILSFSAYTDLLKHPGPMNLARCALIGALGIYTHVYMVFVWAAQCAHVMLSLGPSQWMRRRKVWAFVWAVPVLSIIAFLPWLRVTASQVGAMRGNFWIAAPTAASVLRALTEMTSGTKALLLFGLLAGSALWAAVRPRLHRNSGTVLFAVWALVSVGGPLIYSLIWTPAFYPRYLIAFVGAAAALAAIGFFALPGRRVRAVIACLGAAVIVNSLVYYYTHPHKEDWRSAAAAVARSARPNDLVILHAYKTKDIFAYYFKRTDVTVLPFPTPREIVPGFFSEASHRVNEENLRELAPALSERTGVWLVRSHPRDPEKRLDRWIGDRFEARERWSFREVEITRFVLKR